MIINTQGEIAAIVADFDPEYGVYGVAESNNENGKLSKDYIGRSYIEITPIPVSSFQKFMSNEG